MKIREKKSVMTAVLLGLGGFLSGIVNALLGTGGGIIITFLLSKLYASSEEYSTKDIFSMTLSSVAIMSAGTAVIYLIKGFFKISDALLLTVPAAIGGAVGALVLDKATPSAFKKIFAVLVVWAGIWMVIK